LLWWKYTFSIFIITPACSPALCMYIIIHAYVTTMAATAITISRRVARIGDIPRLDFKRVLVFMLYAPFCWFMKSEYALFNLYEPKI